MKEIGGYLELDNFKDNEYYKNFIRINTGRNALIYLLRAKNIRKLFLPYFLCDSIKNALLKEKNIEIEFYHIDKNLL